MIPFSWEPPAWTDALILFQRVVLGSWKRNMGKYFTSFLAKSKNYLFWFLVSPGTLGPELAGTTPRCDMYYGVGKSWKIPVNLILWQVGSKHSLEFLPLTYTSQDCFSSENLLICYHSSCFIQQSLLKYRVSMCGGRITKFQTPEQDILWLCTGLCFDLSQECLLAP